VRNIKFHALSFAVVLLGSAVFFLDISRFSYVRAFTNLINLMVAPLLKFKEHTVSELREEISVYIRHVDAERENLRLRRRLRAMLLVEKELSACMMELSRLEESLGLPKGFERLFYSSARIIYYDPTGLDLFVVIKGGKDRGFKEGDLVVTRDAVLGMIERVFGSTSRVITPFNERFSISVVVGSGRKRYIYRGSFPEGKLLHVGTDDKVLKDAKVYIAGTGKVLPPFEVGKVKEVRRGKDPFFKEVKVKPTVVPRAEDYVFVIRRGG